MLFIAFFVAEIAQAFKLFDKNGDGQISVEELGKAMKQAGQEMAVEDLKDMITAVDRNSKWKRPAIVRRIVADINQTHTCKYYRGEFCSFLSY